MPTSMIMAVAICAANAADCGNCNVDSDASRTESCQRPRLARPVHAHVCALLFF
jgi:hypothetical protein